MKHPWVWHSLPSQNQKNKYVASLRLSPEQVTAMRSALHKIVRVCHKETDLAVDRVVTCGSVGKKTAVNGKSDLDLVVYLKDYEIGEHGEYLDAIRDAVDARYPGTRDTTFKSRFSVRYLIEDMEIDILVGMVGMKPLEFSDLEPLERQYLSASVSHLNMRFLKQQPLMYHDLVRVVKEWRDSYDDWETGAKPKSYLLEVLMLRACRLMKGAWWGGVLVHGYFNGDNMFERFLLKFFELVGNPSVDDDGDDSTPELFVYFGRFYGRSEISSDALLSNDSKAKAVVMDPVNPTNNLWLVMKDGGEQFVQRAKATAKIIAASVD